MSEDGTTLILQKPNTREVKEVTKHWWQGVALNAPHLGAEHDGWKIAYIYNGDVLSQRRLAEKVIAKLMG